ncbi:MAG: DNA gyrase subunit A [Bacteroidales bacterium]|nr:DNA gyrase subunit A [Bacteroidales bacterium]MBQ2489630.1 DNA gyrase subunit A [Bacteroidales bacterium]
MQFGQIVPVDINKQMKNAYIDYAMSVIVARALPDVRDGFKPVHRRIMYAMWDTGNLSNHPTKKSARIVGEVLGKYHPHGDTAVYDAMARMAQDWSMRYPLVDGQGNFGSIDGDRPAAMRYTEARMKKLAEEMMVDIEKETVDFQPNFDEELTEPVVLPAKIPNLLVNGSSGIAVGMATNMPPHNLTEVVDGVVAYIDNPEITVDELMQHVKAPDFPTGCTVYGYDGVQQAYRTGRGRVIMRGTVELETAEHAHGKDRLIITSIPYQVNKSEMVSHIADMVKEGRIDGIAEIRDESKKKVRVVLELRKDAMPKVVMNKLYQYTPLQSSFGVNNVALVDGRPQTLNLKELIHYFVKHRHDVVVRRCIYELRKAKERAHILEGLLKALDIIDEIIALIRASKTVDEARNGLMERWQFSEIQASAIVEMRLRQLTGLEREKLQAEFDELQKKIQYLTDVLANESMQMDIIKSEMLEIKAKYGDERLSQIEYSGSANFRIEDMIADDAMVITISHMGYIKRTSLAEYKVQNRGGKGSRGSGARDADFIEKMFMATNHNHLLFFTEKGRCYWLRVFEIPEDAKTSKGRAVQNLLNIEPDDKIKAVINVTSLTDPEYIDNHYVVLCTEKGIIKKTTLEAYSRPRQRGINAIIVRDGDTLLDARLTDGNAVIMMALHSGKAVRFKEEKVRPMGRNASGVKGVTLASPDDRVVGMICVNNDNDDILVVSEKGYGKRSSLAEYRETNRGGKGVKTISITDKTGHLIAIKNVNDEEDLMIINRNGVIIRMKVSELRVMGRATQGVRLINLKPTDEIASVTQVPTENEEEAEETATPTENGTETENETNKQE